MSASNWTKCPRCSVRAAKKQESMMAKLKDAGLDDGSFTLAVGTSEDTFREDYEIYGAETGTVTVSYGGSCAKCGLSIDFDRQHEITGWNG